MNIAENLELINSKIKSACIKSGRNPQDIKLVAVSKFHPAQAVIDAVNAGQLLFGENRVQEAVLKFSEVRQQIPECHLHIIGQLQRNKVKSAVEIADCIQSVDRIQLLDEIEKQCAKIGKTIDVLLEIHTGEESKSGFEDFDSVTKVLQNMTDGMYPHINPCGFMTMAPNTQQEELIRMSFRTLKKYSVDLQKMFPSLRLTELSMGMSNDFEIAIEEGATMIRIGTAIFGQREYL